MRTIVPPMECNRPCVEFCQWIQTLPCHVKYSMSKEKFPQLPECFRETFLGEFVNGSERQFRGPHSSHVYEFGDRWILHRDLVDADRDPLGHLVNDAPEYLISAILGAAIGIATGRQGKEKALMAAGLTSIMALVSGKLVKIINGDSGDGEEKAPKLG